VNGDTISLADVDTLLKATLASGFGGCASAVAQKASAAPARTWRMA
jgi:hypothetical protein